MKYHYHSPWHVVAYERFPPDHPELLYSGPCAIERLPDSLLLDIFELDDRNGKNRDNRDQSTIESIVAVSQRWERIAAPILYSKLELQIESDEKSLKSRRRLFNTLAKRDHLRSLTRDLTLHIQQHFTREVLEDPEDVEQLFQLLDWWRPHLRYIGITGDLARPVGTKITMQVSQGFPLMRKLHLSSSTLPVSLACLLKHFDLSTLQLLSGNDIGWNSDPDQLVVRSREPLLANFEPDPGLLDQLLPLTNLETIVLGGPDAPAGMLKPLFMFPKSLRKFDLHHIGWGVHINSYTTHAIQKLVDLQAGSLREFSLGNFAAWAPNADGTYEPQMLDVRHMPNLEKLSLNAHLVLNCLPTYVAAMISAPRLRCLQIAFDSEDQHDEIADLNETRRKWLTEFAIAWSRKRRGEGGNLEVFLDGYIEAYSTYTYDPVVGHGPWAWQEHEAAKQELATYDIKLSWTEPEYTEAEWQAKTIRAHEEHERERLRSKAGLHGYDRSRQFDEHVHDARQLRICRLFMGDTPSFCVH